MAQLHEASLPYLNCARSSGELDPDTNMIFLPELNDAAERFPTKNYEHRVEVDQVGL